ncbi:putative phage abortive infection protein [Vibrio cyclitrophicus]|uniref:putative phage abortive infection protein n=1 Tax=Vibrio cyclitrophicus TaxID=47951 RepID=UPI0007EEE01C|nr:putative phage abortive infection protein [Vibrio cyclitrophicus]OBT07577.1 hypothetical protein A9265_14295 [Vibrio cyclitrophicus]
MNQKSEDKNTSINSKIWFIAIAAIMAAAMVFNYYDNFIDKNQIMGKPIDNIAAFLGAKGDFIGGILNPIFGFLSLLALLYTIILQSKELSETRAEIKRSAEAQKKSEIALNQQALENTFFNMLNLHTDIVKNLEFHVGTKHSSGRAVFQAIISDITGGKANTSIDIVSEKYTTLQVESNHILGHYFRNLFQIISYVHNYPNINHFEKKKYIKMVRAQLSAPELSLLFLNCLDNLVDEGQFRALLIEYAMLEHLPFSHTLKKEKLNYWVSHKQGKPEQPGIRGAFELNSDVLSQYLKKTKDGGQKTAFGKNVTFESYLTTIIYEDQIKQIELEEELLLQELTVALGQKP